MTGWVSVTVVTIAAGVGLILVLERVRRYRDRWDGRYTEQIQILKSDTPLDLPAVKPLQARVVVKQRKRRAAPFSRIRRVG